MTQTRHQRRSAGTLAVATLVALVVAGCGAAATTATPSPTVASVAPGAPETANSPAATSANASAAATPAPPDPGDPVVELPADLPEKPTYAQLAPLFAYHSGVPFEVTEKATRDEGGVTVRDITYTAEAGQRVDAYLVVPAGGGPFPAVLFEHGMGDTRDQFIDEAIVLARQEHVVGLVPTRPVTPANNGTDEAILQIREMRHELDLLESQPGVDRTRLGYVGFSMGAVLGAEIVAFESRIKTAVLMEGVPAVAQDWLDTAVLAPHAKASLLFMFGSGDTYYQTDEANAWAALFEERAHVKWYNSGHSASGVFMTDCTRWLADNL